MTKPIVVVLALLALPVAAQGPASADLSRLQSEAQGVTIVRDDWGIAHISGRTDADAVFGLIYAQAEDDFNRVETNYLTALGRNAEADGESAVYQDLRMKLFVDPQQLQLLYRQSPLPLRKLMDAYADGLNYFLATHPAVKPKVITRCEPWMALSYTEGSIGGDVERVNIAQLQAFYDPAARPVTAGGEPDYVEPTGSNGIAIAPANTAGHHALLLINPHTSFFFRSEVQVHSDEGLNAYGAVTWGQFFVYQGFNDWIGWMHTSSGVDNIDEFLETVTKKEDGFVYRHGADEKPVQARTITVPYRTASGVAAKTFTVYRTEHGPVVRAIGDKWVSVALMQDPVKALTQSYTRTKARTYQAFRDIMELHTNSSNNTVFADADGNIAYFHSNYIPKRDPKFDWTKPVDGSDPATDYKGLLSIDETPGLFNPASGWIYNSNNAPWTAAGPDSPKKENYPVYVDRTIAESPRGIHAVRVLSGKKDFTVESLIGAAFDSYLPAFAEQIPVLVKAWDSTPDNDPLKAKLVEPIKLLRAWDDRWSVSSVATSLAVFYGEEIGRRGVDPLAQPPARHLQALAAACDRLTADFGSWRTPWGDINRFQRFNDDIASRFDDARPSIPVGFTSSRWGSLASFGARPYPNTKKWYGNTGNSFVAAVEFGDRIRARAVTAGGESGDPSSPHFSDQAERYATGNFREVYFYPEQLKGHTERTYHPGEEGKK